MKIIYVTSNFCRKSNSASIRNASLIKGLIDLGNTVDVLTIKYNETDIDYYLKKNLKIHNIYEDSLSIMNRGFNISKNYRENKVLNILKTILKQVYFFPDIDKEWIRNYSKINFNQYDLLITSSDTKTSHYIGKEIQKKFKLKWIQIWGDPWVDDINIKWFNKLRAKISERTILKKADKIFYVSELTTTMMKKKYKEFNIDYIPRGYFQKLNKDKEVIKTSLSFCYTGTINSGKGRNIYDFLEALEEKNIKIEFNFYGSYSIEEKKKLEKFKFVKVYAAVDFEKILDIYSENDVLVFVSNGEKSTQIPGKLYDYFGTNKNILCLINKEEIELKKFIEKHKKRCIVLENKKSYILKNFDFLLSEVIQKRECLYEYSPKNIARIFLEKLID
ncbi:hypothetical protein [Cetobacterium sp.]|uniref:hypothetical protein n=1 Tax=Cetobacterium sp. TaxID=2071632 RepID=UPI003F413580